MLLKLLQRNSYKTMVIILTIMMMIKALIFGKNGVDTTELLLCLTAPLAFLVIIEILRAYKHSN